MPENYLVNKEKFKIDCQSLITRINNNIHDFDPDYILTINEDGLKTGNSIISRIKNFKNKKIISIKNNNYEEIPDDLNNVVIISGIQNTGKTLSNVFKYIEKKFPDRDINLILIVLYNRLKTLESTYIEPTFFGIGFVNHNYIEVNWDNL